MSMVQNNETKLIRTGVVGAVLWFIAFVSIFFNFSSIWNIPIQFFIWILIQLVFILILWRSIRK